MLHAGDVSMRGLHDGPCLVVAGPHGSTRFIPPLDSPPEPNSGTAAHAILALQTCRGQGLRRYDGKNSVAPWLDFSLK